MQNQTARALLSETDENTRENVSQYADALMKSDWIPLETTMQEESKLFSFCPKGHGGLSFFVVAKNEMEAFSKVDAHVKEHHFDEANKPKWEAQGWGTDYYVCEIADPSQIIEHSND